METCPKPSVLAFSGHLKKAREFFHPNFMEEKKTHIIPKLLKRLMIHGFPVMRHGPFWIQKKPRHSLHSGPAYVVIYVRM